MSRLTTTLKCFLQEKCEAAGVQTDDIVNYKQWTTSGQSKLQQMSDTVTDFVSSLCTQASKATSHQFIVKTQSAYLRKLKEDLKAGSELIILMDFAENYSFICHPRVSLGDIVNNTTSL